MGRAWSSADKRERIFPSSVEANGCRAITQSFAGVLVIFGQKIALAFTPSAMAWRAARILDHTCAQSD
jgi:hypothetical protein